MTKTKKPFLLVLILYLLCFVFRFVEYFLIQTDRTFWGEAFLHKLAGIVILCVAVKLLSSSLSDIGFQKRDCLRHLSKGLLFGLTVFAIAYGTEAVLVTASGKFPSLQLYVSSYAVDGNTGNQTGLLFFAICILGNIINVVMEEGVFRGLFQKLLEQKYRFIPSAVITSVLFGVWHVIAPIRQFYEGGSVAGMVANIAMLVITSALVGFQFSLMVKLTGSLYMAMGAHFVNNTIVNILHVVSSTGADELMFVRISIAQALSFILVLLQYLKKSRKQAV